MGAYDDSKIRTARNAKICCYTGRLNTVEPGQKYFEYRPGQRARVPYRMVCAERFRGQVACLPPLDPATPPE